MELLLQKYKGSEQECDEKHGWFKPGLDSFIRNAIADCIKKSCFDDDSMSMASSMNIALETMTNEDFNDSEDENMAIDDE